MIREEIRLMIGRADHAELRKFGRTIGIFLGIVATALWWAGSSLFSGFGAVALIFVLAGQFAPGMLKPIFVGWMSFAVVMGFFMTKVILTLLFSIVFAPAGLLIRLLGKDPLKQRIDRTATSYWISRDPEPYSPVSTEKQY